MNLQKLMNKIGQLEKDIRVWKRNSIYPCNYFREITDREGNVLYSRFDKFGYPTHMRNGDEISKNIKKKLAKQLSTHVYKHQKYLKIIQINSSFLEDMETKLKELQGQCLTNLY